MQQRTRTRTAHMPGALLTLAALLALPALRLHAQPFAWDPPCTQTQIVNRTACDVNFVINTASGPAGPFAVPAGGAVSVSLGVPPTTITGVTTLAGTVVAPVSPGPIIPFLFAPIPGIVATGFVSNVTLGPGCCCDVYFDASHAPSCSIWLEPSTAPPPCTK